MGSVSGMGYKLLGFAVWQIGKLAVRRKVRSATSTRNVAIAAVVGAAIVGLLISGSRSSDD
jgi:hypothetical protein